MMLKPVIIEIRTTERFSYEYRLIVQRRGEGPQMLTGQDFIHPRKIKEFEDRGFNVKIKLPKAWFNPLPAAPQGASL